MGDGNAQDPVRLPGRRGPLGPSLGDVRGNGLAPEPPDTGRNVLVTGGAGYIGCVLTERLLERGYRVRVLDRLYWGEGPLEGLLERIDLAAADVRDMPS